MSDDFILDVWLGLLDESLGRLAEDAKSQTSYLVGKGVAPSADELGLEFDTGWRPVAPRLLELTGTEPLKAALDRVDDALDADDIVWDVSALAGSAAWANVRELAGTAREILGEWRAASANLINTT